MQAQNYDQLWEDMQTAFVNDLPKSALTTLQTIREKALAENNNPQLLRALCTERTLAHEISPDSDAVVTRRIEEALAAETRPVERALWESALGQLTHSRTHLLASVSDVQLLASVKATDYLPLFVVGKDSRWFSDDLLSVLAMTVIESPSYYWGRPAGDDRLTDADRREVFLKMRAVYEAQHNEEALLLVDYYGYTRSLYTEGLDDGKLISRIRQTAPKMKGNTYAAAVLTAWADAKETPDINVDWRPLDGVYAPGIPAKAVIRSRNVGRVELRLYRIKGLVNTDLGEDSDDDADRRRVLKSRRAVLTATYSKDLQRFPAHETFSDTLDFNLPDAGIYIARLIVDGKTRSTSWMHVSRVAPLVFSPVTDGGVKSRLTLVDVVSGRPFTEGVSAKVGKENTYNDRITWTALEPAADGTFTLPHKDTYDYLAVGVGDDHYCTLADPPYLYTNRLYHSDSHQVLARTYTDRAIYRPGQTVQFNTLVYSRDVDEYKAVEGWKGKVVLQNTERKDIAEFDVVTDAMGQCSGEFRLPDPAIPGSYAVVLRGNDVRNTQYITVEEYKRPTFRVVITAPDSKSTVGRDRWEKGDTITLEGRVETYSGIGIPDAQVRRTTSRSTWLRYGNSDQSEVADTLTTDADGRFRISIPLDAEGFYSTQVEATASNGETASAHHNIYVGTPVARNSGEEEELRKWCTVTYSKDHAEATLHIDATAVEGVSSDDPLYLFVDVVSTKGDLDASHRFECGDSLDLSLKWRPEFGDAATLYVSYVRCGHCVSERAEVIKPEPDKRLMLEWSTFRNLLQPGEQETWSLTVRRPDGSPADATVMARLYDASLDAFARSPWTFSLNFPRTIPFGNTSFSPTDNTGLFYSAPTPYVGGFILTAWEPTMFDYFALRKDMLYETVMNSEARVMGLHATSSDKMRVRGATSYYKVAAAAPQANMAMVAEAEESAEVPAEMMDAPVRENFNETAFFLPALRTDAEGCVAIAFTLPESLTEWNFTAFAHDAAMNYGVLNDTVVARKMLMAEIAAPRFLRQGDTTEIPVTVRNLTDETQTADVLFVITDAATDRTLKTVRRSTKLDVANTPAATVTLTFPLEATTDVRVRVVAKAATFSDGEERLIPVLSGRELVQASVPFSSTEEGTLAISLETLGLQRLMKQDADCRPTLSVEYCANPIWSVIRVVPALLEGEAFSATDWATHFYTIEVADFLAHCLHDTPSQTLIDSLLAASDIPALRYLALHHLNDFQSGDGGFSWLRGFQSSAWITADVAVLLARQQALTGSFTARDMLRRATAYLQGEAGKYVTWAKKEAKNNKAAHPSISEVMLRYLYVRQLQGLEPDKDAQYLLAMAADEKKNLTMYGKGLVAQILQQSHSAEAALALQSLVEHTVATPEMGRYFDTDRALSGWSSYKIPTQTMAIEALESTPDGGALYPGVCNEMRLWLLQSKRTQKWESSRASADATYALLHGSTQPDGTKQPFQTLLPEDYSKRTLSPDETKQAIRRGSVTFTKNTPGLSWGAIYADYTLPTEMVESLSAGFTLSRSWEVQRNGKWVNVQGQQVKVGEHVRQTITVRAERDYDFVQLEASRAACMEPLHPLSGVTWLGGTSCYRMVRDSRNDYYFEHLAKGIHTFVEELIVDRAGTFATGTAHVYSTFAPEFRAYAPSMRVFAISE